MHLTASETRESTLAARSAGEERARWRGIWAPPALWRVEGVAMGRAQPWDPWCREVRWWTKGVVWVTFGKVTIAYTLD